MDLPLKAAKLVGPTKESTMRMELCAMSECGIRVHIISRHTIHTPHVVQHIKAVSEAIDKTSMTKRKALAMFHELNAFG